MSASQTKAQAEAEGRWIDLLSVVAGWRTIATTHGIGDAEQHRFAPVMDRWTSQPGR